MPLALGHVTASVRAVPLTTTLTSLAAKAALAIGSDANADSIANAKPCDHRFYGFFRANHLSTLPINAAYSRRGAPTLLEIKRALPL